MKKIKYGNRDKTKEKRNPLVEDLKEEGDQVCGAVLDSFSNDYLSYITGLVRAAKTPHKVKTEQPPDTLEIKKNKQKEKANEIKKIPINVVSKTQSKQVSPKSPKSYNDLKNSTLPLKKMKEMGEQHEINQIKRQRDKSASVFYDRNEQINPLKLGKTFNVKQHYNRYPTQQAQKVFGPHKNNQTSIAYESEQCESIPTRKSGNSMPKKQFLQNLDQYLHTLESQRNFKKMPTKINCDEDDLNTLEQIYQQNVKLRKKIKKYEQKMSQIQDTMSNHFIHCRKQEKSYKSKIGELTELLFRAIKKVSQQKQQLDEVKSELKSFGRKAQNCIQKYENQSSDSEQDIHESLLKAIRPSRVHSQYKLKRKLNIPLWDFISKDQ